MKYVAKNRDQIKSERTPFLKLYTDDWIAGTIELDFEEKGFYFEVLLRMWERKGTLPDDDKWLACALGCNPRTVRKLVSRLASTSHLQVANGIISNRRMMREISQHLAKSQPELVANSDRIEIELDSNSTGTEEKTQTKSTTTKTLPEAIFQIPEPEEEKDSSSEQYAACDDDEAFDFSNLRKDQVAELLGFCQRNGTEKPEKWLSDLIRKYGTDQVINAHNAWKRKSATEPVKHPMAFFLTCCQQSTRLAPASTPHKPVLSARAAMELLSAGAAQ